MNTVVKKTRRWLWILCFCLVLCTISPAIWTSILHKPGKVDFWLYHTKYDSIVRTMKAQLTHPSEASTKQLIEGCEVCGTRSEDGKYTITIKTCDWGHLGMFGYLYADAPPASKNDPYSDIDAPGELWMKGDRLNNNWWTVYNNLN